MSAALRQPGRAVATRDSGYYVLSGTGFVGAYNGAPSFGSPSFNFDIARDIAMMPDGAGYIVLDGYGGLHKYGSARQGAMRNLPSPGYWPGWDIARSLVDHAGRQGARRARRLRGDPRCRRRQGAERWAVLARLGHRPRRSV